MYFKIHLYSVKYEKDTQLLLKEYISVVLSNTNLSSSYLMSLLQLLFSKSKIVSQENCRQSMILTQILFVNES